MASDGRSVTSQLTRECTFSDSVEVHARVFLQSSTHSFPSYLRGTGRLQSQRLMAYGAGELNERNNTERERGSIYCDSSLGKKEGQVTFVVLDSLG